MSFSPRACSRITLMLIVSLSIRGPTARNSTLTLPPWAELVRSVKPLGTWVANEPSVLRTLPDATCAFAVDEVLDVEEVALEDFPELPQAAIARAPSPAVEAAANRMAGQATQTSGRSVCEHAFVSY